MSKELTDVRCSCGDEYPADSYDAGFIAGSGMCQNCDAALPPKDICTCPSGDGSLRHPCPAHPAVEQAGGDERVIGWRERILAAHPNSDPGFWPDALLVEHMAAEIADLRAALAQPSPKCATCNDRGHVCLDWEAGAWEECPDCAQAEAERPEVVSRVVHSNPVVLDQCAPLNANDELMTVAQHAASVARWAEMFNRVEQERDAALAEVERLRESKGDPVGSLEKCMKVMYERDENAKRLEAALARVAELERGKVYVEARQCDECQHGGINDSATGVAACHECDWTGPEPEEDRCPGCQRENCMAAACPQCGARYVLVASEEIAAPVAQAQQLNDLDKQCRDDVARALGLRPSQERGFAWSYLLASIKSCVEASEDAAQAQHSVPEGYALIPTRETEAMHDAVMALLYKGVARTDTQKLLNAYIAAAPGKEGV
ncbi:TPA: hypothetical protein QCK87_001141 [Pseudomonas aeruginosa]|nr:hypothetical protein [Pseudomonas aeruginosa]HDR3053408.1 hypothetical protein [Pseudomonas aeruginosa]HDR3059524.1 hypothetical protein [Pseudomonas aeruginosa]HDR3081603.1 hypothetical protein [Pseudomonas aeruginosa]HDR3087735.1 hypothetical protein [Pseudomonas aeruginosa]